MPSESSPLQGSISDTTSSRPPSIRQYVSRESVNRADGCGAVAPAVNESTLAGGQNILVQTSNREDISDPASEGRPARSTVLPTPVDCQNTSQDESYEIVSPETQNVSSPTQEGPTTVEEKMLDILTKMYEKMEGQHNEGGPRRQASGQARTGPFRKTYFGMPKRDRGQPQNSGNDDYEQIFPEDAYGEEAGPSARVFRVYNEEATAYDVDMIGQASDSSDVLLVFAGLFSAVLTTFVVQTSQALQKDDNSISTSLLSEITELLRLQANETSLGSVKQAITEVSPSKNDLWVNGLWFTSLTLSLTTALFAVLTKQWLRQYISFISGTIRHRSITRQFRFAGMEKWHVITIIGALPILLHVALGVFLAGLVVFLTERSIALACIVGAITSLVFFLYFITNLLPIITIQCPYRTPFSDLLNILSYKNLAHHTFIHLLVGGIVGMTAIWHHLFVKVIVGIVGGTMYTLYIFTNWIDRGPSKLREIATLFRVTVHPGFRKLGDQERNYIQHASESNNLSCDVIWWLMDKSSNPSAHSVAVQAVGGLSPSHIYMKGSEGNIGIFCKDFMPKLANECLAVSTSRSRLERFVRMYPVLMRTVEAKPLGGELFDKLGDLDYLDGMVSVLSCSTNTQRPQLLVLLNHLLHHSPEIKLSPYSWINLLWASKKICSSELELHTICAKALQNSEEWGFLNRDHDAGRVSISAALASTPQIILHLFQDYDESSADLASQTSLTMRLRALLTLHCFAAKSSPQSLSTSDTDSSIQLRCAVWTIIYSVFSDWPDDRITIHDYYTLYAATTQCLVESPLLTGYEWKKSDQLSKYCEIMLLMRRVAIERWRNIRESTSYFHFSRRLSISMVPNLRRRSSREFLERLADISFPPDDVDFCDTFRSSTRIENIWHWSLALANHVEDAYIVFRKVHVLGWPCCDDPTIANLVAHFVFGLYGPFKSEFLEYLYQPSNLFATCKILSKDHESIVSLASLRPTDDAWVLCRARLRDWAWRPDWENAQRDREKALRALDTFFEEIRQYQEFQHRLNPMTIFRGTQRPPLLTDIELQQLTDDGGQDRLFGQPSSKGHLALPKIVITVVGNNTESTSLPSGNPVTQSPDSMINTQPQPQAVFEQPSIQNTPDGALQAPEIEEVPGSDGAGE